MAKFIFIFIHIGVPAVVLLMVLLTHPRSKLGILLSALTSVSVLVFLYYWGQWPIAFTLYFKYILPILVIACLIKYIQSWRKRAKWLPRGFWRISRTLLAAFFGLFVSFLAIQVIRGRSHKNMDSVALEFPLKQGKYYVGLGGTNGYINNHYGTAFKAQWYALDFNKLTKMGSVANPMWSDENNSHAIFGETLFCPCDGKVIEAKAHVEDNEGASMNVSPEDGMGNYISLDCNSTIVTMVHLKQHSLSVKVGDEAKTGEALAKVGNSGFSQEPHLHIQAAQYQNDSILMGVPIQFNGRFLARNDVFKN